MFRLPHNPLPRPLRPPYTVAGVTYVPQADPNYRAEGPASFYGPEFSGSKAEELTMSK
jgi:rare lipoprotein A (peptidoglycan hydrolase)